MTTTARRTRRALIHLGFGRHGTAECGSTATGVTRPLFLRWVLTGTDDGLQACPRCAAMLAHRNGGTPAHLILAA